MRRLTLISALMLLLAPAHNGQTVEVKSGKDAALSEKTLLLSDLHALETRSAKLDEPISRALATAEIADAVWSLDKTWAKQLLREAYELTFPKEEERAKLRGSRVGDAPVVPNDDDRARSTVRNRILTIAGRDKAFADELARLGAGELGRQEEHTRYSSLAAKSLAAGDRDAARDYIRQAIEADPAQITVGFNITGLAERDRKAADDLTIQYISRLRSVPLTTSNGSALRTYFSLRNIVFTNESFDPKYRHIPPAGMAVVKAYLAYVVESMIDLERREPGSAQGLRGFLVSTWVPLNRYAPELVAPFLELEKLSRGLGGSGAPLPSAGSQEMSRERYEERVRKALDGGEADDMTINSAIGREDFAAARKLIGRLPEGERKKRFSEIVDAREAISLAANGDLTGAETLARRLSKAVSILQVYPAIIDKCVANKDSACATSLTHQAVKQLGQAEDQAAVPLTLSRLAKSVAGVSDSLALEVLEEAVAAANRAGDDLGSRETGLDTAAFRQLAPKNEVRARQAAEGLKKPLAQIVSLAAIYQWKAEELSKRLEPKR